MYSSDVRASWVASAASVAAALSAAEVKAAPSAGQFLHITKVVFSNEGAANSSILKDGDATAIYPPTGAVYLGTNQTFVSGDMDLVLPTAAKNLNVTTSANDHSCTIIHGYTK